MSHKSSGSITRSSKSSKTGSLAKDSKLSYEEGDVINYDDYQQYEEGHKLPPKTGEYYYQDYKYVRPTQLDFERKPVQDSKLFDKRKIIDKERDEYVLKDEKPPRDASILVTGFGMRNVSSFQKLINMSREERRKWELKKLWREEQVEKSIELEKERKEKAEAETTARSATTEVSGITEVHTETSSSDLVTQTDTTIKTSEFSDQKQHLDYLLGLETAEEEEAEPEKLEILDSISEDDFKYSSSKSIREAQRYLRAHRIFECFQFIVTHLLSANAENPIEFILNLFNRCLLYRSGLGEPPLLYEKKHIDQLFNLMDRLQSGFIDYSQYKSGMKTLGICTYNENPEENDEDLISKETFIEEAYEAELAIFNDLIKRRPEKVRKKMKKVPSGFDSVSLPSLNPPFFIPSDLFKFSKEKMNVSHMFSGE